MYKELEAITSRPEPYQFYTAEELWTDKFTAKRMLEYHLSPTIDAASRNTTFIDKSVEWIASHFQVGKNTRIIDFGCGPGLYTTRLARKGAEVTGIDFSNNSIQYAKKVAAEKELKIRYHQQNYLEFETTGTFDLITMIMCDFCAMSPEQRKTMLGKFSSLLNPNGSILLDVYSLKAFEERQEVTSFERDLLGGFWSPEHYFGFLNTFKYTDEKVILDKYTIIEPHRTRTVYNWLQHFSKESLAEEVEAAGLQIKVLYTDVAGTPFDSESSEFAVILAKQ